MPREDIDLTTIEFLRARDAELAEVQARSQAAVAALTQRIRIALEIQALQASEDLPIF